MALELCEKEEQKCNFTNVASEEHNQIIAIPLLQASLPTIPCIHPVQPRFQPWKFTPQMNPVPMLNHAHRKLQHDIRPP